MAPSVTRMRFPRTSRNSLARVRVFTGITSTIAYARQCGKRRSTSRRAPTDSRGAVPILLNWRLLPATERQMAKIDARERLIVALDLPDVATATQVVSRLERHVDFFKVGLSLQLAV